MVEPMLRQYSAIYRAMPQTLLLDAGYCSSKLLALMIKMEIDILTPPGRPQVTGNYKKTSRKGKFIKSDFRYDEERECYICPNNVSLPYRYKERDNRENQFRVYRAPKEACNNCPLKDKCTTNKRGRTVRRYAGDELKEAMLQVFEHPAARAKYKRRMAMVEPVFAELSERFGLVRFNRRGLENVKVEFSLYCIAYNLKKALRMGLFIGRIFYFDAKSGLPKGDIYIIMAFIWF